MFSFYQWLRQPPTSRETKMGRVPGRSPWPPGPWSPPPLLFNYKFRQVTAISMGVGMRLARCLSPLNSKLNQIRRGYSWMGDHVGIASCWFSKKLGTHVSRVVVVDLSRVSRFFSRFSGFPPSAKSTLA